MSSPDLEILRELVDRSDAKSPDVSSWSVGMHIEHCCLVVSSICGALAESVPPPPPAGVSLLRSAMLKTGFIPRGRGRAPKAVIPTREPDAGELRAILDRAAADQRAARELSPEAWFRHFAFGIMNRDETLRFLAIHNAHHAKIIRDVIARAGKENRPSE